MLFLRLWHYVRGYVIILVEGFFLEKFLNICTHRQIFLWDVRRREKGSMAMKISIKAFKRIRPIAKKTRCRVRIMRKKGLPFVFSRYRGRKTFFAGAVIFIALIYTLTSFVWVVEITGHNKLELSFLQERLALLGVKPGVLKYRIDADKVVNEMMLRVSELSWISLSVKGTRVVVDVRERVPKPQLVPKDKPCNIVALKDGIIHSMITKDGEEMVKVGDTVTPGQVLISGVVPVKNQEGKTRLVHALGTVTARTWYEKRVPVNTRIIKKERTGKTKDYYSLSIFGRVIKLFHGEVKYRSYDTEQIKKELSIGKDLVFPFALMIDRYYENHVYEEEISLEEAKEIAYEAAYKEVKVQIPPEAQITATYKNFIQSEDGQWVAVVTVECLEEIGMTKEIGGE